MTEERDRPAPRDHHAGPRLRATLIVCGQVPGLGATPPPHAPPCYQALDPWGRPDAGLPWFRVGAPPDVPSPLASGQPLAEILGGTQWLLLVVGPGHDSLALALALASWARARGLRIAAFKTRAVATPSFLRRALQEGVHYFCACPPGVDALAAARALVMACEAARRSGDGGARPEEQLLGNGHLAWLPARAKPTHATDCPGQAEAAPRHPLFAVQVGDDGAGSGAAMPVPGNGTPLLQRLPVTAGLSAGTYLFLA